MAIEQRGRDRRSIRPEVLHLGCGEDYREGEWNVDVVESVDPDEVVDLNERPWPWADNSVSTIRAEHVFEHLDDIEATLRECARVLRPDGYLITAWPIGLDALADPTHQRLWTWRTPEMYCGSRHWDTDVGLSVENRTVELWSHLPGRVRSTAHTKLLRWFKRRSGPGPWCFDAPFTSGEFRVVFRCDG